LLVLKKKVACLKIFSTVILILFYIPNATNAQVTNLILGETKQDSFSKEGEQKLYRIFVEKGKHLFIVVDDLFYKRDNNSLFIKYLTTPTNTEYDQKFKLENSADQILEVLDTQEGFYYILLKNEDIYGGNTAKFNITAYTTDNFPSLTLGVPDTSIFNKDGDLKFYQLYLPPDEHLIITLKDYYYYRDQNELFIKYGTIPTRNDFDEKSKLENSADQILEVMNTKEGYYYILVSNIDIYGGSLAPFTITATLEGIAPPIADFQADVTTGEIPLEVHFTNLSSNEPITWYWDFGDSVTSIEQNPIHTYTKKGEYSVSLTVSNNGGYDIEKKEKYIKVTEPLMADFKADVRYGKAPLQVHFTDLSTGEIESWEWNFGDGEKSDRKNPVHEYIDSGDYTVSLKITGQGLSDKVVKQKYITVETGSVIVLPNVITPNDDGFNDSVSFIFVEMIGNNGEINIYNFSGRLVKSIPLAQEMIYKWDGNDNNNSSLPPGVYLYRVSVSGKYETQGSITLVR